MGREQVVQIKFWKTDPLCDLIQTELDLQIGVNSADGLLKTRYHSLPLSI